MRNLKRMRVRKKLSLTLACGDYEIVRPLIDGKVAVDGVDLTILTDMDSATRHWRFLNNREFDIAEVSASSYLAARDNDWPFRAIPVFLHRRFRHGFMFVNTGKGIAKPADLKAQAHRRKDVDDDRSAVDARHLAARIRRAAQFDRMGGGNRGRRRRQPVAGTSNTPC